MKAIAMMAHNERGKGLGAAIAGELSGENCCRLALGAAANRNAPPFHKRKGQVDAMIGLADLLGSLA